MRRLAQLFTLFLVCGCAALLNDAPGPADATPAAQSFNPTTHLVVTVSLGPEGEAARERLSREFGAVLVAAWPLQSIDELCLVFRVDQRRLDQLFVEMSLHPDVIRVQNVIAYSLSTSETVDGKASLTTLQTHLDQMNATGAHQLATGRGVRVAIVDTGLDHRHPDLAAAIEFQRDFVEDGRDATRERHGTAVAGVIGARGRTLGVAFETRLESLRSCWESTDDAPGECNTLSLARALNFATVQEIDIVNLSIAGPYDPLLSRLIDAFVRSGGVVVAALDEDRGARFPGSHPRVIAARPAGSAGRSDAIPAPSTDVLSTSPGETYDYFSGASIASAQVAGVVALMKELDPTLSAEKARAVLGKAVRPATAAIDACRVLAQTALRERCR